MTLLKLSNAFTERLCQNAITANDTLLRTIEMSIQSFCYGGPSETTPVYPTCLGARRLTIPLTVYRRMILTFGKEDLRNDT